MRAFVALGSIVLALLPALSNARVFERQPRPRLPWERFLGWECISRTPVLIHGTPATLATWAAPESLESACRRILNQAVEAGHAAFWIPGEAMALGAIAESDRIHQLLAMTQESGRQTLVFALTRERNTPDSAPPAIPEDLPSFPGARLRFHFANEGSQTTTLCWETPLPPEQAQAFFAEGLRQKGWQPAVPGATGHPLTLYLKGHDLCAFSAEWSRQDHQVLVTVLHHRMERLPGRLPSFWRVLP